MAPASIPTALRDHIWEDDGFDTVLGAATDFAGFAIITACSQCHSDTD